jgi:hypothetical protein
MAQNIQQIIDYYVNLLIIQYHSKPKAKATIELFINELLASGVYFDVRDAYNVDTAIGKQLDVIGKYVFADRYYQKLDLSGFFSLTNYDEDPISVDKIGYTDYTDGFTKEGKTLTYKDVVSESLLLGNTDFRRLIKLKIIQNSSNHSHKAIDDSLWLFFGEELTVTSSGNMQMTYLVKPELKAFIEMAIQKDILPRPMGVKLNYSVVE